jgi:hypothetical protein
LCYKIIIIYRRPFIEEEKDEECEGGKVKKLAYLSTFIQIQKYQGKHD